MTLGLFANYITTRSARTRLVVDVAGLPYYFCEEPISASKLPSPLSSKSALVCLERESFKPGEFDIDEENYRITGATASFSVLDDSANILRGLIAPRSKPVAWVTSGVTSADGFIPTNIAARSVSSTPFYIGGETVVCTNWAATVMTVARGAFGSTALPQYGDATGIGAEIYAAPRSWRNRKCTVYIYAVDDSGVAVGPTQFAVIYTGTIDDAPSRSDGGWEFNLRHASESVFSSPLCLGQREINIDPDLQDDDFPKRFYFSDVDKPLTDDFGAESRLMVTSKWGTRLAKIAANATDYVSTIPQWSEIVIADDNESQSIRPFHSQYAEKVRHVIRLRGNAADVAAKLMGNSTLPSVDRAEYGGQQWRFDAGLADYFDAAQFTALRAKAPMWDSMLVDEMRYGDVLRELCVCTRSLWFISETTGKIAFMPISARDFEVTPSVAITKADVDGEPQTTIMQGPSLHSVSMSASFDPISGKHLAKITSNDAEIAAEFGSDAATTSIDTKFIALDIGDFIPEAGRIGTLKFDGGMSYADALAFVRRIQRDSLTARAFYSVTLPLKWVSIEVGDAITYTDDRVSDGNGSTASGTCYVVGKTLDPYRGTVTLKLQPLRKGWRFAPAAMVTAYNAGTKTATLDAVVSGTASPGLLFAVGGDVYAHNCSTGTLDLLTIASRTATTITFVGAMSAYTSGYVFVFTESGTSSSGRTRTDYANQVPTSGSTLGDEYNSEWG